jgi:hypothetical protein
MLGIMFGGLINGMLKLGLINTEKPDFDLGAEKFISIG